MAAVMGYQKFETDHVSPYRADGKLVSTTAPVGKVIDSELAAHGAACVYACSSSLVIGYPFTAANEEDTLQLIDDVLNAWGRLDVFVTSSGLLGPPSIAQTMPADLSKLFEVNSMAPLFALKYAPPAMAKTTSKGSYANAAAKVGYRLRERT